MSPAPSQQSALDTGRLSSPIVIYDSTATAIIQETSSGNIRLGKTGGNVGFYGTTPIALQTGVAVTAGGVHAACVALGLFTA